MDDVLARLETQMAVLARRIENASRKATAFEQMDRAAYLIARTLDDSGPSSVNEIARALALDGSTVTRQVAAMETRRQVTRKVHPDDGRAWVIGLTPGGRKQMSAISDQRRQRFAGWLAEWTESDIDEFGTLLQRFNEALSKSPPAGADAPPPNPGRTRRTEHRQSVVPPRRARGSTLT